MDRLNAHLVQHELKRLAERSGIPCDVPQRLFEPPDPSCLDLLALLRKEAFENPELLKAADLSFVPAEATVRPPRCG